jgi:hypothetical protein
LAARIVQVENQQLRMHFRLCNRILASLNEDCFYIGALGSILDLYREHQIAQERHNSFSDRHISNLLVTEHRNFMVASPLL